MTSSGETSRDFSVGDLFNLCEEQWALIAFAINLRSLQRQNTGIDTSASDIVRKFKSLKRLFIKSLP